MASTLDKTLDLRGGMQIANRLRSESQTYTDEVATTVRTESQTYTDEVATELRESGIGIEVATEDEVNEALDELFAEDGTDDTEGSGD